MRWGAVVVAAGRGTRMGAPENKVFLPLAGRSVLEMTLEAFERCARAEAVVIAAAADEIGRVEALVRAAGFGKVRAVVAGGADRQASVKAGLEALETEGALVHDAARPLVTPERIEACCRAAEEHGAAALAVPVKDTIKVAEGGMIVGTPDRSTLLAVQTPQAFGRLELLEAHRLAKEAGASATDDAMLFERLGRKVAAVPGHETNLKITTPEDLLLAELILQRRREET
ncbi:2-C-methyl-D-erythritol 4-phosphate cytidylyltransferase [Cohnella caldifontis]|uniref:2-C-methyl-D-erythritol 4-phosphate cytidylyltransferase n=1 Tax=Cohnella caldifontis TaxID=3027471 RepID=UPI0023ED603A|nr:2-C-methyl-D-erythritol 4-phosphate cytidylyltransferase [Cohnella sp. YIM B05605]